ncbi:MAG: RNA polymerase factor sigma-54 [Stellaceae bacterium]
MALSQRLDLRQSQALVMTPQLQQAIKLLQLSNIELASYVEGEIEQNPLLERDEGPAEDAAETTPAAPEPASLNEPAREEQIESWDAVAGAEGEGKLDLAGDPSAWKTSASRPENGDLPGLDQTLARATTLREHLLAQLAEEVRNPADRVIGAYLVDQIDEAGYLAIEVPAAAEVLGCVPDRIERVLAQLQRFDPAGIFARDLAECLAIQLKERNRYDPAMQALVEHLPLVASRNIAQLQKLCGVDAADLAEMVQELRALDPKPGLAFDGAVAQPVVPEVFVRPLGAGWAVELNSDALPRVLINTRYYAEVSASLRGKSAKDYLAERYQSANWLVKALHQRATTVLKVAREIVRQQDGFLRRGVQHLRPLVLRDIAQAIGMHESTVSRVTTNKYIMTPRGIFELKYFFTASIAAVAGGDALSAEAVRFRIRSLIGSEANEVLSDDRIVDILMKEGIDIARRTVAKYREAMSIPSSVHRRREKALHF